MKGDSCGFLHQFDPQRMPVCRTLLKFGVCKEPDCPYKHTLDEIKECNMYKLGFCIYGPACRFKHTRQHGPPPDPTRLEACKPKEVRNINVVANQANEGIAQVEHRQPKRPRVAGAEDQHRALPSSSGPTPSQQNKGPLALTAGGGGQTQAQGGAGHPLPPGPTLPRGHMHPAAGAVAAAGVPMQQQQQQFAGRQPFGGQQAYMPGSGHAFQPGMGRGHAHHHQQQQQQFPRPFVDTSVLSSVGQANLRYGF